METVKIKNKITGVVKEVKKSLAGDYIGTGNFVLYKNEIRDEMPKSEKPNYNIKEK